MKKGNNLKFYRNREQGTNEADYQSLILLSALYGVSINQLLGEKNEDLIIISKEQYVQLVQAYDLMTKVMKNIRKPTSIQIKNQVIIGDNNSNNNNNINNG